MQMEAEAEMLISPQHEDPICPPETFRGQANTLFRPRALPSLGPCIVAERLKSGLLLSSRNNWFPSRPRV